MKRFWQTLLSGSVSVAAAAQGHYNLDSMVAGTHPLTNVRFYSGDVDAVSAYGQTLLMAACQRQDAAAVQSLLTRRPDLFRQDTTQVPPRTAIEYLFVPGPERLSTDHLRAQERILRALLDACPAARRPELVARAFTAALRYLRLTPYSKAVYDLLLRAGARGVLRGPLGPQALLAAAPFHPNDGLIAYLKSTVQQTARPANTE